MCIMKETTSSLPLLNVYLSNQCVGNQGDHFLSFLPYYLFKDLVSPSSLLAPCLCEICLVSMNFSLWSTHGKSALKHGAGNLFYVFFGRLPIVEVASAISPHHHSLLHRFMLDFPTINALWNFKFQNLGLGEFSYLLCGWPCILN